MGKIYSFLLYVVDQLCPLSLLQNIYTNTKLKYCPLSALDIISLWRLSRDCSILLAWLSVVGSTAGELVFIELLYCLGR